MSKTIKLFVGDGCPNCPQAKKVVEDYIKDNPKHEDIRLELWNVGTVDGLAESAYYDVFSTPTVLVLKDNKEVKRSGGVVREEDLK